MASDLPASRALSILQNGPQSFAGRKIGVLAGPGADPGLVADLRTAAEQEQATLEFIAPAIGGVAASDGSWISADQKIDGGPSVLYDAVVVLCSTEGASELSGNAAARDFVTDAYAHYKFIGHCADAEPLFAAAGLSPLRDGGFIQLGDGRKATDFVTACRELRFWTAAPPPDSHPGVSVGRWRAHPARGVPRARAAVRRGRYSRRSGLLGQPPRRRPTLPDLDQACAVRAGPSHPARWIARGPGCFRPPGRVSGAAGREVGITSATLAVAEHEHGFSWLPGRSSGSCFSVEEKRRFLMAAGTPDSTARTDIMRPPSAAKARASAKSSRAARSVKSATRGKRVSRAGGKAASAQTKAAATPAGKSLDHAQQALDKAAKTEKQLRASLKKHSKALSAAQDDLDKRHRDVKAMKSQLKTAKKSRKRAAKKLGKAPGTTTTS